MSINFKQAVDRLVMAAVPSFDLMITGNTLVIGIGIGTTGSLVELSMFRHLLRATGGKLPANTRWISIDADTDSRDKNSLAEQTRVPFIPTGATGAGTVINNGYDLACKSFPKISQLVLKSMSELTMARDDRFRVNLPPSQMQTLLLIAGSTGGTSGGTLEPVSAAGLLAANRLSLEQHNIVVATVGGEIPWRDVNRSINADGRHRIMANYAESVMWRCGQMATQNAIKIDLPGKGKIRLPASTRIATSLEFDWESDFTKLNTTEQVVEMMSASLFQRYFTAVGSRRESRLRDDVECGRTGQKHPLLKGVTFA